MEEQVVNQSENAFDDDHWWEEKVVNHAEEPFDGKPWWIILPDTKDRNHPMNFCDSQLSSACSSDDPLPRWVASTVQFDDAKIVQSVVESVLVNF